MQDHPGAFGDGRERVVGDVHGKAGLFGDEGVESAQQPAAARQDETAVDQVGRELGGAAEVTVRVLGRPLTRSRPLTSMVVSSSRGNAEPMEILISSAVRSPTIRL